MAYEKFTVTHAVGMLCLCILIAIAQHFNPISFGIFPIPYLRPLQFAAPLFGCCVAYTILYRNEMGSAQLFRLIVRIASLLIITMLLGWVLVPFLPVLIRFLIVTFVSTVLFSLSLQLTSNRYVRNVLR